jgi:mono/diheme cytochrome c family protein
MRYAYFTLFFVVVLAVSVLGFRGTTFSHPPIEIFFDMDHQAKYKPMADGPFFADGRADRPLPPGVVPASLPLRNDDWLFYGKDADGNFAKTFPPSITIDDKLLARGQDRFTIYCSPCHGALGDGNGITKKYGMSTTPSYDDEHRRAMTVGEIFSTITKGSKPVVTGTTSTQNMFPYADKLTPEDRWAVVAYVRALQRAQRGTVADVPADHRKELGLP